MRVPLLPLAIGDILFPFVCGSGLWVICGLDSSGGGESEPVDISASGLARGGRRGNGFGEVMTRRLVLGAFTELCAQVIIDDAVYILSSKGVR